MSTWSKSVSASLSLSVAALIAASTLSSPALGQAAAKAAPAVEPDVIREGEGPRRKALDQMELKPFPAEAWSKLSDWTNGPALTPGAYSGKVVLILTWADWYPASVRALALAKRIAEKHAADGLVVVAAHDDQGWKEAKKPAAEKDATFLLAYDAKNEFRKAIMEDQDPDFYIIDRAGQLRYADITTESVEGAVDYLLKENAGDAAGLNLKLAADAKARDIEQRRTDAIRASVDMTSLPEVPFTMPGAEAYKDLSWPKMPRDPNLPPPDPKNPDPPTIMAIPEVGFFPKKPEMKGRAVLLYFWHPDLRESYEVMPYMDLLQKQHARDLVVIGVLTPLKGRDGQDLKLENDPEHVQKRVEQFAKARNINHTLLTDLGGSLFTASSNKNQGSVPIPWIAVISSDNTLRWGGWLGLSAARGAIDKVLAVDPAVRARQKAEEEYIRSKNK